MKVCLLVVDPQVDFCSPTGKLSVKGADKDMKRLAAMIKRTKRSLDEIVCTLDSHHYLHISHPVWWVDQAGNHPTPFTLINEADVVGNNPKWKAFNPGYQKRSIDYVQALAKNNRYVLCVWEPHCLIGSMGTAVYPILFEAFCEWEAQFAAVNYVTKGSNIFTEHYSVVAADVYDPEDLNTGLNTDLIKTLQNMDVIAIAGEASSHCVCNSVQDVANNFGDENIKKFMYLEDCCSPVPGFEKLATDFVDSMTKRGMKVTTSDKFLK